MCQIIFSILSYFVCFVQAFSASLGILYTRRGNGHGHELDHYDNATHFGNLCNHQRQRHSVGCSHRHRRAGRYHPGNFHGRFPVSLERCREIDGTRRSHRRPLPSGQAAAEPAFSQHQIRSGTGRISICKYLRQLSGTWKCRHPHGNSGCPGDVPPQGFRHGIGRDVPAYRAEYCVHPADSGYGSCCPGRPWLHITF